MAGLGLGRYLQIGPSTKDLVGIAFKDDGTRTVLVLILQGGHVALQVFNELHSNGIL